MCIIAKVKLYDEGVTHGYNNYVQVGPLVKVLTNITTGITLMLLPTSCYTQQHRVSLYSQL